MMSSMTTFVLAPAPPPRRRRAAATAAHTNCSAWCPPSRGPVNGRRRSRSGSYSSRRPSLPGVPFSSTNVNTNAQVIGSFLDMSETPGPRTAKPSPKALNALGYSTAFAPKSASALKALRLIPTTFSDSKVTTPVTSEDKENKFEREREAWVAMLKEFRFARDEAWVPEGTRSSSVASRGADAVMPQEDHDLLNVEALSRRQALRSKSCNKKTDLPPLPTTKRRASLLPTPAIPSEAVVAAAVETLPAIILQPTTTTVTTKPRRGRTPPPIVVVPLPPAAIATCTSSPSPIKETFTPASLKKPLPIPPPILPTMTTKESVAPSISFAPVSNLPPRRPSLISCARFAIFRAKSFSTLFASSEEEAD